MRKGFTLIELLVAAAIIGIISVISVNLLYSTVISRARQNSIQSSSEDVRFFVSLLTKSIHEATNVSVPAPTEVRTTGSVCRTFRLSGSQGIEMAEETSPGCIPPTTNFSSITDSNTTITTLNFSMSGNSLLLSVSGNNKDSFGKHEFSYSTTIVPRI